jgi:CubicO group peptidase (beta-lactamase class C family)
VVGAKAIAIRYVVIMFPKMLVLWLAAAAALFAQDQNARVDEIFKQWAKPESPGASVAIIRNGKPAYARGYGSAQLEYDAPIAADTIFHVASVSKQFTAMSIVLLEQDGKLSLEDDIHKYLPELPDYGHAVTIRQLLQHTSGMRDQWQTLGIAGWRLDDVITQKQILRMLFRQRELNFTPGTQHLYSNGGFTLLAEIVARVSGKTFPDFAEERIFRPLGMTRTHFHDDHLRIVPGRAYSYEATAGGFRAAPLNYANAGATSLFTTAPDLLKWLDNFREPKVGGAKAIARLQEQAVLADGSKIPYALGLAIGEYRGLRTVSHSGGDAGYRSYVVWFPDQQLGVAVLSNLGSFNTGDIANRVATVYLEQQMKPAAAPAPQPAERTFITLEPAAIARFTGFYRLGDTRIEVAQKDGKLVATPVGSAPMELRPFTPTRFYSAETRVELEFTPKPGNEMDAKLTRPNGFATGQRGVNSPFDPGDMEKYTGRYWSEELETQYTIVLKDGKLSAEHAHHGEIALRPFAKDELRTSTWFMPIVRFTRDGSGAVTGMILGGNRLTGVRFARR